MAEEYTKKSWYKSKTFWVNLIALIAIPIQAYSGYTISAGTETSVLAVINLILRTITKEEITW